jgi:two-component system sensor histidine kinase TctE
VSAEVAAYSLRRRLLLWLLMPLTGIGLLALLDTWREAVATANTVSDRVLAGSALAIAERVVVAEDGSLEVDIPYVALEMLTSAAQDRVFYRVDGPPGNFITGYQNLPVLEDIHPDTTAFANAAFRGENIRVAGLARSASTGASSIPFVVTVAETTIARTQLARAILLRSALRLGVLIAGAALIVWVAVTASLGPLYRLRDAIAVRSPGDLHPIETNVPQEVRGLIDTVNSFMARLGSAISGLRNFTGNASHQLRTPMTIVRTQLALATRAASLDDAKAAVQTADEAVVSAERVLAQLLLLAQIDETASERLKANTAVDLVEIAHNCVADRVMQAGSAGIDLGFEGEGPHPIRGEPLLLGEMIRNLVDNAIAYAGPGSMVTVRVQAKDRVTLEVEDNGPGIPAESIAKVRQRFSRGGALTPGSGLGLPIVEEIAALFGGRLNLSAGAGGRGLKAQVEFPPLDPSMPAALSDGQLVPKDRPA